MIYCILVDVTPYPGFGRCFVVHTNYNVGFLWVLLIIWDARECERAIH